MGPSWSSDSLRNFRDLFVYIPTGILEDKQKNIFGVKFFQVCFYRFTVIYMVAIVIILFQNCLNFLMTINETVLYLPVLIIRCSTVTLFLIILTCHRYVIWFQHFPFWHWASRLVAK